MIIKKQESLGTIYPEIARQWHPTKNGKSTPWDFKPFSNKKAWWICEDNPQHEWVAVIAKRSMGRGCPYCAGKAICKDNSLLVINPELAKEWHPLKNGSLKPQNVRPNSHKEIWWLCKKNSKHEWIAKITDRHSKRNGCPFCSGRKATEEDNLEVRNPELANQWHPLKNGKLTSRDVKPNSAKKVWWLCKNNPKHMWEARIYSRHREGVGCPYCANQKVYNENSLAVVNPIIAKEWHPLLNGDLTPWDVVPGSKRKVWWKCKVKPDHEWNTPISARQRGDGCPFCSKHRPSKDYNLLVCNPELARQWHPIKNGHLTPSNVTPNSYRSIWWRCGRNPEHEWVAKVSKRNGGQQGCPFCNPQISRLEVRVFCELSSIFRDVVQQKNINNLRCDILISDINAVIEVDGAYWHRGKIDKDLYKSQKLNEMGFKVFRIREFGLDIISGNDIILTPKNDADEYKLICLLLDKVMLSSNIPEEYRKRFSDYKKCGCLVNKKMYLNFLKSLSYPLPGMSLEEKYPQIAKEWNYERNGELTPSDVKCGSGIQVWWKCSSKSNHEWLTTINHRTSINGTGCPYCAGKAVSEDNCLATLNPELAKQWHRTKNGEMTPYHVTVNSNKKVWWVCPADLSHEWEAVINKRNMGQGCPWCWKLRHKKG